MHNQMQTFTIIKAIGLRQVLGLAIITNITLFLTFSSIQFQPQKFMVQNQELSTQSSFDQYLAKVNKHESEKLTKVIYFVNNENNTIGRKGLTYNREYFLNRCNLPCVVTNDKEYLGHDTIDEFDALIFKVRFFKTDEKAKMAVPNKRSPHQRYIMSTHESSREENIPAFINDKYLSK